MMGYLVLLSQFPLLHRIIQKEIYQNSVDCGFRVVSLDLPPDQFNTPDATTF